jgi:hypothetical protein
MEDLKLTKLDKIKMINAKLDYEFIKYSLEDFYSDKDIKDIYQDVVIKGKQPVYVDDACYLLYPIAKYAI